MILMLSKGHMCIGRALDLGFFFFFKSPVTVKKDNEEVNDSLTDNKGQYTSQDNGYIKMNG